MFCPGNGPGSWRLASIHRLNAGRYPVGPFLGCRDGKHDCGRSQPGAGAAGTGVSDLFWNMPPTAMLPTHKFPGAWVMTVTWFPLP
ncbi:MAG: hypothetical protein JWM19_6147 [Actinomycetia bacterium]|nr:hypothetical protein [Actinomycetes bacterium]